MATGQRKRWIDTMTWVDRAFPYLTAVAWIIAGLCGFNGYHAEAGLVLGSIACVELMHIRRALESRE